MKKIFDQKIVNDYLNGCIYKDLLLSLEVPIFICKYSNNEMIVTPWQDNHLFQIIVEGDLHIYYIREDGSRYSLSQGEKNYFLGDMDLFIERSGSIYAESSSTVVALSIDTDLYRDALLNNNAFLRMLAKSTVLKMVAMTDINVVPASIKERVLSYIMYRCSNKTLKGVEQAAFSLHCSPRHLQRILNEYVEEGVLKKVGKGTYSYISA